MPRIRVVAAVVLALALMVASCSDSADQSESDVDKRQQQLKDAYNDGEKARQSIDHYGLEATEGECKAHYGRHYFVKGCMEPLGATGVAQNP